MPSSSESWRPWAVGLCGDTPAARAATDEDLRRSIATGLAFRSALVTATPRTLLAALDVIRQHEEFLLALGETRRGDVDEALEMLRELEEPSEVLQ